MHVRVGAVHSCCGTSLIGSTGADSCASWSSFLKSLCCTARRTCSYRPRWIATSPSVIRCVVIRGRLPARTGSSPWRGSPPVSSPYRSWSSSTSWSLRRLGLASTTAGVTSSPTGPCRCTSRGSQRPSTSFRCCAWPSSTSASVRWCGAVPPQRRRPHTSHQSVRPASSWSVMLSLSLTPSRRPCFGLPTRTPSTTGVSLI